MKKFTEVSLSESNSSTEVEWDLNSRGCQASHFQGSSACSESLTCHCILGGDGDTCVGSPPGDLIVKGEKGV